jgi:hypothetical protein
MAATSTVAEIVADLGNSVKGVLFWLRPEERILLLVKLRDLMSKMLDEEE